MLSQEFADVFGSSGILSLITMMRSLNKQTRKDIQYYFIHNQYKLGIFKLHYPTIINSKISKLEFDYQYYWKIYHNKNFSYDFSLSTSSIDYTNGDRYTYASYMEPLYSHSLRYIET